MQAIIARTYAVAGTVRATPDAPLLLTDVGSVDQEFRGVSHVPGQRAIGAKAAESIYFSRL